MSTKDDSSTGPPGSPGPQRQLTLLDAACIIIGIIIVVVLIGGGIAFFAIRSRRKV